MKPSTFHAGTAAARISVVTVSRTVRGTTSGRPIQSSPTMQGCFLFRKALGSSSAGL